MPAPTQSDYSFGERAASDVYEELRIDREQVIDTARRLAKISIPHLFPPQGWRPGDNLPPPNQSFNSRIINNLASRIMITALPPGQPVLKYNIVEYKLQPQIDQDPTLYAMTLLALGRRAMANKDRLEATNIRTAYVEAAKQLLEAGNVMWRHMDIDWPSTHRMDSYVVKRDAAGQQLFNILCMNINLGEVSQATAAFITNIAHDRLPAAELENFKKSVDIHCCCKLYQKSSTEKVWLYWEEFMGEMIPGTDVMTDFDAPVQFAAWMIPNYGFNWGSSYCQDYEGDMYIVENSEGSSNDIAEAAGIVWLFVKPGGTTSKRAIEQAENGKVMYGSATDITAFQLEKMGDAEAVENRSQAAQRRLGAAFLLVSSIQRDAERVTAEEWKMMASELDEAMGGLYSSLAQGLGRTIITRFLALQEEEDPQIKPLPKGIVRVGVITGLDAMGVSDELENLQGFLEDIEKVAGPQGAQAILNITDLVTRLAAGHNVKPDGLVKTDADMANDKASAQNDAAKATVLKAAAGPVAKAGAGAMAAAMTPQMVQQMQAANGNGQGAAAVTPTPPPQPTGT